MDYWDHAALRAAIGMREERLRCAEYELRAAVEEAFPEGMELISTRSRGQTRVVSTGRVDPGGAYVWVTNPGTGKTYRVWYEELHHPNSPKLRGPVS